MKVQRIHSVGFIALSCALVLRSDRVHASTSDSTGSTDTSSDSTGSSATSSDSTGFTSTSSDFTGFNTTSSDWTGPSPTSSDWTGSSPSSSDWTGSSPTSSDSTGSSPTSSHSTGSSPTSSDSTASCLAVLIADGNCDTSQNIDLCGYDGGDCCECTCLSTADYVCGESSDFVCVDPGAACVDETDDLTSTPEDAETFPTSDFTSTLSCFTGYFSDGFCDLGNNNEDCGYDGGDCCECTCVSTDSYTCGDGSTGGYACLDPSAPCVNDDDVTTLPVYGTYYDPGYTTSLSCFTGYLSDGYCDMVNNSEECGYDGGDCCECTCKSTTAYTCGTYGFACVDPSASCVDDDDFTTYYADDDFYTTSSDCIPDYYSDGDCDPSNNNDGCGYDGGDCCQCTCESTGGYVCGAQNHGGYDCVDPMASCVDDDDFSSSSPYSSTYSSYYSTYTGYTSSFSCNTGWYSDGFCDAINNSEDCGYDGGDCCQCTCVSGVYFYCADFACLDPSASCVDDDDYSTISYDDYYTSYYSSSSSCDTEYISDGDCDPWNNNERCGYDGGDCCECTCLSTEDFACGDDDHGGYACVDPSAPCVDDDDVTTITESTSFSHPDYTTENGCDTGWFSDGLCDTFNNNAGCGYDGGDCCECTCVSTKAFNCGDGGFGCIDPRAACVDDDDYSHTSSTACDTEYYSDGDCDPTNNNEDCGYDGGDCCRCTCVDTEHFDCGDDSHGGFACIDPDAECVDDDDVTVNPEDYSFTTADSCIPGYFGDGDCDPTNNNKDCDYDEGDCCQCDCDSNGAYVCGDESHGGYACIDPSSVCVNDDDITATSSYTDPEYTSTHSCSTGWFSDGLCDPSNNNDECEYDGGDCCECTCESGKLFTCGEGGYGCVDPRASCVDDDNYTVDSNDESSAYTTTYNCETGYLSDGDCDPINNKADCGYDGGDCCECTCESTVDYTCGDQDNGGFACIDPSAECVDDDDVTTLSEYTSFTDPEYTTENSCNTGWFSDGLCDSINNNEDCDYDGGDCCQCTCVSGDVFACGYGGYACLDPDASCVDDDDVITTSASCIPGFFSDGDCDDSNNNSECGYDGGDCCECTCVSTDYYTCGDNGHGGFDCLDPDALCPDNDDSIIYPTDDAPEADDDDITDSRFHPTDDAPDADDDMRFLPSDDKYSVTDEDDIVFLPTDDYPDTGNATSSCVGDRIADGACDSDNNNQECGYDGGDCCDCDCVGTEDYTCGHSGGYDCINPSSPCVDGYVEAGTKTAVGVSANAYDTRPGEDSGGAGCQEDGCTPALSRDGVSTGTESRWACAQKLVSDGGVCEISFTFDDPQDIKDVQVAFYKGEERSRTLQAAINGEVIGNFASYTGSTFNALGIEGVAVQNVTFASVDLAENDWISFVEVRFLVDP